MSKTKRSPESNSVNFRANVIGPIFRLSSKATTEQGGSTNLINSFGFASNKLLCFKYPGGKTIRALKDSQQRALVLRGIDVSLLLIALERKVPG